MVIGNCLLVLSSTFLAAGCAQTAVPAGQVKSADIASLSDEFSDPKTLPNWLRIEKTEGWNNNQLESLGINQGWMTMVPYTSAWYKDYRGIFLYKDVNGDFVVTTRISVSNRRQKNSPPNAQFSLAGIMVRAPREIRSPQDWREGGENYTFLATGAADRAGTFQFEVKTTTNSDSQLKTSPAPSGTSLLQVAKIGNAIILLRNEGNAWVIHQRYLRRDFPSTMQVGLTCYTDWPNVERVQPRVHNTTVIRSGQPDLVANFDYVHFQRPSVPASLSGKSLADPGSVSDSELLSFLGDHAK